MYVLCNDPGLVRYILGRKWQGFLAKPLGLAIKCIIRLRLPANTLYGVIALLWRVRQNNLV